MSRTKKLLKNTLFKATSQVAVTLSHFVLIPVTIKYLGLEGLGIMAVLKLLTPEGPMGLLEFGVQSAIVPVAAQLQTLNKSEVMSRIIGRLILGFLTIGVGTLLFLLYPTPKSLLGVSVVSDDIFFKILLYTLLSNIFLFPKLVLSGFAEGLQNYKLISFTDAFQIIVTNAGQVLLLVFGFQIKELIFFEALMGVVATFIYLKYLFRQISFGAFKEEERDYFKLLLRTSQLVFIGKFSGIVSTNFDKIVITKYFGAQFLGIFEVMTRLPRFLRIFTSIGTLAVTPLAANLYAEKDHSKLNWLFEKGLFINMVIFAGIIFTAILYVPSFFNLWIGPNFNQYVLGTQLLLLWTYFFAFNIGWNMLFGMNRLVRTATLINWLGTIIKIVTFFTTLKWLRESSIIAAYLVPQILAFAGLYYFLREFKMSPKLFIRDFSISLFGFIPVALLTLLMLKRMAITNYFLLIFFSGLSLLMYLIIAYALYPERKSVENLLLSRLKKKAKYT